MAKPPAVRAGTSASAAPSPSRETIRPVASDPVRSAATFTARSTRAKRRVREAESSPEAATRWATWK